MRLSWNIYHQKYTFGDDNICYPDITNTYKLCCSCQNIRKTIWANPLPPISDWYTLHRKSSNIALCRVSVDSQIGCLTVLTCLFNLTLNAQCNPRSILAYTNHWLCTTRNNFITFLNLIEGTHSDSFAIPRQPIPIQPPRMMITSHVAIKPEKERKAFSFTVTLLPKLLLISIREHSWCSLGILKQRL